MRSHRLSITLIGVFVLGIWLGYQCAMLYAKLHLEAHIFSGTFYPAHESIRRAKRKLEAGDTKVLDEITHADAYMSDGKRRLSAFLHSHR